MKKFYFILIFTLSSFFANAQDPFITTWEVIDYGGWDDLTISIPTMESGYNFTVDFGDGTVQNNVTETVDHTYSQPGIYTVSITGAFPKPEFWGSSKLISIEQWGDIAWQSMERGFENCGSLTVNATDAPDLSLVTSLKWMFRNTDDMAQSFNNWDVSSITNMSGMFEESSYNQSLENWDVSNVTDMSSMFRHSSFNNPLNNWDVSSVTNMEEMFHYAMSFNQPLDNWDVSNVTNMSGMFHDIDFNHPLNNWNVSNVTNMSGMFFSCLYNHPLDNWDVSNVTNMAGMFNSSSFNYPIDNWNVSNVTNMSGMFANAYFFNQPLETWDVSNVTHMDNMFANNEIFNYPLNNWDVSNVTTMNSMFAGNEAYNLPLNNWDVSNVTTMINMFEYNTAFNQPLNNWNVSGLVNTTGMFKNAVLFNQPLDNWDVSNVTIMREMFDGAINFNQDLSNWNFNPNVSFQLSQYSTCFLVNSGFDTQNYDALLTQFAILGLENKNFRATGLEYCNEAARNELINNLGWIIYEDNLAEDCNSIVGNIYFDEEENGCDEDDIQVSDIMIYASNGSDTSLSFSNNGWYNIGTLGSDFTVSLMNLPDYFMASPTSSTITFSPTDDEIQLDFCLSANQSIEDLNIVLLPTREARPGFEAEYQLVVKNVGTETIANVSATLSFDNTMQTFLSSIPAPSSTTSNSLQFSFADIAPFETLTIDLNMQTFEPPIVNGDDILNFTTSVTPNSNDYTPNDNNYNHDQIVVNSYDPNDKRVLQGEEIYMEQTGEYLDYIIRFQNTGTASAVNVRILDTLHSNLNWNTIQPISASHNYHVQITDGNEVEFIFNDINLPHEASNEPASHGFIAYKIKLNDNVQIGDIVSGDAEIYFDYNAPIITNTATTEIVENLGIINNNYLERNVLLYPNPAEDNLNIKITGGIQLKEIKLYNPQGLEVRKLQEHEESFDLSKLASGIYLIKIITDQGITVRQLIKK